METRTTTYGKTVEGRRIEGRRKVTYDDVDGDDLSHGAAGARDGARTTRDKCASGEEVGEELSRKERGVISEVSVSVGETLDVGAHVVCLAERIAEEQVAGAADERGESHAVGAVGVVGLVGVFARVERASPFVVHHCVTSASARRRHSNPSDDPNSQRFVRGDFPRPWRGLATGRTVREETSLLTENRTLFG